MHATKKLWTWLAIICLLSFTVLGWVGREIYLKAPPIAQVVDDTGSVSLADGSRLLNGSVVTVQTRPVDASVPDWCGGGAALLVEGVG